MSESLLQFKKALEKYFEDFTVGYQEQPTEEDIEDLYEDFLESGMTLDDYMKHGQQESNG